jgi:hypothetical protein
MHSESKFILRKLWELAQLCAEKRGRGRWINMRDFRDALDCSQIGWKEAHAGLSVLEQRNYLLLMTRGEDGEITDIAITPPTYRCHGCRLMVSAASIGKTTSRPAAANRQRCGGSVSSSELSPGVAREEPIDPSRARYPLLIEYRRSLHQPALHPRPTSPQSGA